MGVFFCLALPFVVIIYQQFKNHKPVFHSLLPVSMGERESVEKRTKHTSRFIIKLWEIVSSVIKLRVQNRMVLDEFNLLRSAVAALLLCLSFLPFGPNWKKVFFSLSLSTQYVCAWAYNILALFSGIVFKYHWEFISYDFFSTLCVLCCWCYFWFIRLLLPRLTEFKWEREKEKNAK